MMERYLDVSQLARWTSFDAAPSLPLLLYLLHAPQQSYECDPRQMHLLIFCAWAGIFEIFFPGLDYGRPRNAHLLMRGYGEGKVDEHYRPAPMNSSSSVRDYGIVRPIS